MTKIIGPRTRDTNGLHVYACVHTPCGVLQRDLVRQLDDFAWACCRSVEAGSLCNRCCWQLCPRTTDVCLDCCSEPWPAVCKVLGGSTRIKWQFPSSLQCPGQILSSSPFILTVDRGSCLHCAPKINAPDSLMLEEFPRARCRKISRQGLLNTTFLQTGHRGVYCLCSVKGHSSSFRQ